MAALPLAASLPDQTPCVRSRMCLHMIWDFDRTIFSRRLAGVHFSVCQHSRHMSAKVLFLLILIDSKISQLQHDRNDYAPDRRFRMSDLKRQLDGYRLTTAEILYHRPDHPSLLQHYIWQDYDMAPRFPILYKFLRFWQSNLDGRLHSVTVASSALIRPAEFRMADLALNIH